MLAMAGCSVDGQITDITVRWKKPVLGQATGIVSAAQQNFVSSGGYKVSSSLGNYYKGMEQSSGGYYVYSSVQGNIAAETMVDMAE